MKGRLQTSIHGKLAGLTNDKMFNVPGGFISSPVDDTEFTAGTGITTGTGTVYRNGVIRIGNIITTQILIDLTGLTSADSDLDIIGVEDTALPCHIGQITAARNGTIIGGHVQCLEAPSSLTDIGIYSAGDGTLVYENLITDESDEIVVLTPAVQAVANGAVPIANVPAADDYLYIVNGAIDTPDIFTAGVLFIELYGYA